MMRRTTLRQAARLAALVPVGLIACSSAEDPFTSGPAGAHVEGVVTAAAGSPVALTTVHISCAGGSAIDVTTDAAGHYAAQLESGADPFRGASGTVSCRFTEPVSGSVRAQVDTALAFARGPVLLARQFVNLSEQ